jgi:large subunit ribosomal protein L6
MSRIGNKLIDLPAGVAVTVQGRSVAVKGPKGQLSWDHPDAVNVAVEGSRVVVRRSDDQRRSRELHGLTRALIANMVRGVHEGYQKRLEIYGTGYGCSVKGKNLELNLGFMGRSINKSPQFSLPIPAGIEVVIETPTARGDSEPAKLVVRGIDKQLVGEFTAEIRAMRKPEPYKGKGVRYEGEYVRRKQGKALAGAAS